jgi:hypothetical protein
MSRWLRSMRRPCRSQVLVALIPVLLVLSCESGRRGACATDPECGPSAFCDRGTCAPEQKQGVLPNYGRACTPLDRSIPTGSGVPSVADPCGGYVCLEQRCRSCVSDDECRTLKGSPTCGTAAGFPGRTCGRYDSPFAPCPPRGPAGCIEGYEYSLVTCSCMRVADAGSDGASVHDAATVDAPDVGTEPVSQEVSQDCFVLSEQACLSNPRCTRIGGLLLEDFCAGRTTAARFLGCVSGGPDGGAAVIWARDSASGKTAQFSTTQLPAGWTQVNMPTCPDAGTR